MQTWSVLGTTQMSPCLCSSGEVITEKVRRISFKNGRTFQDNMLHPDFRLKLLLLLPLQRCKERSKKSRREPEEKQYTPSAPSLPMFHLHWALHFMYLKLWRHPDWWEMSLNCLIQMQVETDILAAHSAHKQLTRGLCHFSQISLW